MPTTTYTVHDDRGLAYQTTNTEHAARLARAGLRVTATMEEA